jgi:hypothetical protein
MSNDELLALARNDCEKERWPWLEPVGIQDRWSDWTVITNYRRRGCNARIVVSKKTGAVVKKSFTPR